MRSIGNRALFVHHYMHADTAVRRLERRPWGRIRPDSGLRKNPDSPRAKKVPGEGIMYLTTRRPISLVIFLSNSREMCYLLVLGQHRTRNGEDPP